MKRLILTLGLTTAAFFSIQAEEPVCLLKYVRASGSQYVNLDYYPTPKTTVIYDYYVTDYGTVGQSHFGSWGGDFSFYSRVRSSNRYTYGYSDAEPSETSPQISNAPRDNGLWKIEHNGTNKTFKIWKEGVLLATVSLTDTATQTASLPMYLFSANHNGKAETCASVAFYGMQIYEDGVLVRDLKPCWATTAEAAIYDTLTKTVYRNAGSGSLVAGPRVGSASGDVHLQPRGEGLDDTEVIIEKLNALGGGDTLYLDEGVFNVTNAIAVPGGVTLTGAGRDKTIVHYVGGLLNKYLFTIADEATFKNLTLLGSGTLSKTSDCLGPVNVSYGFGEPALVEGLAITGFGHTYTTFRSGGSGAALKVSAVATIRDCIITNNETSADAGYSCYYPGLVVSSSSASTLVENCIIRNNRRSNGSNMPYSAPLIAVGGTVRNCLVADNSASRATGLYGTGSARFVNCTVANNTCVNSSDTTQCGACYGSASVEFVNCLITGNKGKNGSLTPTNSTSTAIFRCCDMTEPTYRDAANGDYYVLLGDSINAGTNEDWMATATDIAGSKRILEGHADIGCYEFKPAGLWCQADPLTETQGAGSLTVRFRASVKGADLTGLVYHWAFEKAEGFDREGADLQEVEWTFAPGRYSVRLQVTNTAGEAVFAEDPVPVLVALGQVYLATDSEPEYPYDTPAKAALDFDTLLAEDLVNDGTEIRVCPGTYALAATLTPAAAVRIVSTDGPDVTTLRASANGYQLVKLTKSGQVLSGLTFTGTNVRGAQVNEGMVTNCVFRNFSIEAGNCISAGAGLLLGTRATVVDSLFRDIQFVFSGGYSRNGGAIHAEGTDVTIDRCVFTNIWFGTSTETQGCNRYGLAVYLEGSGTIRNSLFAKCSTHKNWSRTGPDTRTTGTIALVGAGPCRVENCTVVSNLAEGVSTCGGIYCADNTDATVENTILFGNHDTNGDATDLRVSAADPSKTTLLTNLVGVDPKLRRPGKGDYRIRPSSPAVNAGTKENWMDGATDLFGNPRVRHGAVDIGCHEASVGGLSILVR